MISLRQLRNDPKNLNRGNPEGQSLIRKSINEVGYARSLVAAKDGTILAGNHVLEEAKRDGIEPIFVESDGSRPVVVVRTDIDSAATEAGFKVGVYDNQAQKVNYTPDSSLLLEQAEEYNLNPMELGFTPDEMTLPTPEEDDTGVPAPAPEASYSVVVTAQDEKHQRELYDEFVKRGLPVRLLTL